MVYAVLFVALLPFLGWSPRRLLILAGGLALVCPMAVTVATDTLLLSSRGSSHAAAAGLGIRLELTW